MLLLEESTRITWYPSFRRFGSPILGTFRAISNKKIDLFNGALTY
jgi:hypothetical protein